MQRVPTVSGTANLLDILDRVLDKGLVIAGDIRVSLANVELLTIRIRLLICSVDKAEAIGLNWWKYDPNLTAPVPEPVVRRSSVTGRATGVPDAGPEQARCSRKTSKVSRSILMKEALEWPLKEFPADQV